MRDLDAVDLHVPSIVAIFGDGTEELLSVVDDRGADITASE